MPKSIIFCADGTWNGPSEPDDPNPAAPSTNVFKLFVNLDGTDVPGTLMLGQEQERVLNKAGSVVQHAKYLHGVGDSSNYLVRLLGGTVGTGLVVRIIRGYTFISRVYQPGDHIFIVGFSRGAYTARALAGLIAAEGLLDAKRLDLNDKDNAYRLGSAVWSTHFRKRQNANANLLGRAEGFILELPGFFSKDPPVGQLIQAPIEAVAVWDTVGALGIPAFTLKLSRVDLLQFTDTKLSPSVKHGIHAVAIDEERADFTPTLWDADDRVVQSVFPGAHADVGGGYITSESGLSDCGLAWMTARLQALGVQFSKTPAFKPAPDPIGAAHQPWTVAPWTVLARRPREFPAKLSFSEYAQARLCGGPVRAALGLAPAAWAPVNLAAYYKGDTLDPGVLIA
jgi:uncharacterized protein (DUF2235 family)